MFPSGPSATSFGWLMPSARVVTEPPGEIPWMRLLNVSATYTVPSAATVRAVEPCVRRDGTRRRVAPLHASEQLRDPQISPGVVCERRRLLELRDGGDRPERIDVADPPLAVDDPEAAARIDGDFDREADGRPDGRTAVTSVPRPAVAGEESQPVADQAEDAVREVRDQQRPARLDDDVHRIR